MTKNKIEISRARKFPNRNLGTRSVGNLGTRSNGNLETRSNGNWETRSNGNWGTSGSSENLASDDLGQNLSSPTTLVTKFLFSNAIAHEISISNSKISGYAV